MKIKNKIPKFWPTKKLGELLIANDTGIWGEPIHNDEKGILILRSTNFENDGLLNFSDIAKRKIPKDKIKNLQLQDGDILLEKSGGGPAQPVGRVAYFVAPDNQSYTFANFIQRLRPNQDVINSRFLFHCLFYLYKIGITLRLQSQTTGIRNLNLNLYLKTRIPIPLLHIQHQIVEQLDAIKKTQELNDEQIALADELFKSLLNRELDPKGTDRKTNKLEEVAEIIMGQSPPSSTYNTKRNGLPFLQGKFEFGEIYPIPIKFCSQPLRIAKKNDVLLSVRAPVGPVNLAPSECCIGRGLSAIRAKAEKLDQLFLFYFMKLNEERMSLLGCGSTFNAIGRDHIEKIKISLPPLQTQRQVVEKLQAVQDYKKKLLEQKQKLQELFNSCLDKAMEGELMS